MRLVRRHVWTYRSRFEPRTIQMRKTHLMIVCMRNMPNIRHARKDKHTMKQPIGIDHNIDVRINKQVVTRTVIEMPVRECACVPTNAVVPPFKIGVVLPLSVRRMNIHIIVPIRFVRRIEGRLGIHILLTVGFTGVQYGRQKLGDLVIGQKSVPCLLIQRELGGQQIIHEGRIRLRRKGKGRQITEGTGYRKRPKGIRARSRKGSIPIRSRIAIIDLQISIQLLARRLESHHKATHLRL